MVTYKHSVLPIDLKKSTRWGIAALKSIGVGLGPVGGSLGIYDLVNMETYRAHRMALKSGGIGKGIRGNPISGSFTNDDYTYFTTSRPANFPDFDGIAARLTSVNAGLYSWNWLTIFDGTALSDDVLTRVKTSGGGANIPTLETGIGMTEVLYSDGRPVETPEFVPNIDLPTKEDLTIKIHYTVKDDALVIKIHGDVLFDFDKSVIKPEADKTLRRAAAFIRSKVGYSRISIEGHTDSKGSEAHNLRLSKQRADAVERWFTSRGLLNSSAVKTVGWGEKEPAVPNTRPDGSDDPAGRAQNRRVEILLFK